MMYPELHLENSQKPYILIKDLTPFYPFCDKIYIDPNGNPFEILYNLLWDFLTQYQDGYEDGFLEGMNNGEYEDYD